MRHYTLTIVSKQTFVSDHWGPHLPLPGRAGFKTAIGVIMMMLFLKWPWEGSVRSRPWQAILKLLRGSFASNPHSYVSSLIVFGLFGFQPPKLYRLRHRIWWRRKRKRFLKIGCGLSKAIPEVCLDRKHTSYCEIWGSHGSEYEQYHFLECDTVQSGRSLYRRCRGTRLHLRGQRVCQASKDLDDRGSTFFWNVRKLLPEYTSSYARRCMLRHLL